MKTRAKKSAGLVKLVLASNGVQVVETDCGEECGCNIKETVEMQLGVEIDLSTEHRSKAGRFRYLIARG